MVHYILSPRAPVMETLLALEISEALERRAHALQQPATPHGRNGAAAQTKEAELLRDLVVVTPGCRDLSEIMWYPHAAAWSQLRAPLLFWPPQTSEPGLLTASRPVIVTPLDGHTHSETGDTVCVRPGGAIQWQSCLAARHSTYCGRAWHGGITSATA